MTRTSTDHGTARLRVGFDAAALRSRAGGIRRYVTKLTEALGQVSPELDLVPVHSRRILPTNLGASLVGLPYAARAARLDVFHAPAYTAPLWGVHPLVLTIHDVSYARHPEWYPYHRDPLRRAFYRRCALAADLVITDSTFSAREIEAAYGIGAERVRVVPLAAAAAFHATDTTSRQARARTTEPIVLHVGDLHARRNLGVLVETVAWLRRHRPELGVVTLYLVGRDAGAGAALRGQAQHLADSIAPLVRFIDDADDDALRKLYERADVLAYPSLYEGFGLPVIEAMAAGLPVVASSAAALPEVVGDGGLLVDPLDVRAWIGAIDAVLGSAERAAALRAAGLRQAARFSWARTAALTLEAYHDAHVASHR